MQDRLRHAPIELRAAVRDDAPAGILEGYASVYDVEYRIGYGLREAIAPGAFSESLAQRDGVVPVFYQHEWNNPIGYAAAREDDHGLHVTAHLFVDVNERAASVYAATAAGALREWSIGFVPTTIETRNDAGEDSTVEYILGADLLEASVVVKGANPETEMVGVRSEDSPATGPDDTALEAVAPAEDPEPAAAEASAEEPALPDYILDNLDKDHVREILRGRLDA
jgi:HK97 family phage prohead protease